MVIQAPFYILYTRIHRNRTPDNHGCPFSSGRRCACASRTSSGRLPAGSPTPAPRSSTLALLCRQGRWGLTFSMCHFASFLAAPLSTAMWIIAPSTNDSASQPCFSHSTSSSPTATRWFRCTSAPMRGQSIDFCSLDVLGAGAVLVVLTVKCGVASPAALRVIQLTTWFLRISSLFSLCSLFCGRPSSC